jgi:tagaturonate reductase
LREIVVALASTWHLPQAFLGYLRRQCTWANSLVDRIVSSALHPIGAVAEPYALWAIEQHEQMILPCEHPAIVVTPELGRFERLKLMFLNLGHSFLAECWLAEKRSATETVRDAMRDSRLSAALDAVWNEEVLPVFDALGEGTEARAYLAQVRDRLCNPFLEHRIADIARDHAEKKRRRFVPVIELASMQTPPIHQPRLRAAMGT